MCETLFAASGFDGVPFLSRNELVTNSDTPLMGYGRCFRKRYGPAMLSCCHRL